MLEEFSCDYLGVGALGVGASGLAFVDELNNHDCGDILLLVNIMQIRRMISIEQ